MRGDEIGAQLISVHNIAYQLSYGKMLIILTGRLMRSMRESILSGSFKEFVGKFMLLQFPNRDYPKWVVDALLAVEINLP